MPGTGTLGTPGPRPSPPPASCPALSQAVTRATTCWGGAGAGAGSWLPSPLYTSPMAAMRLVVNSGDWAGSECRWVWRLQDTCGGDQTAAALHRADVGCYPVLDEVPRHGEAVRGGGALLGEPHPPEVEDGDGMHTEGVGEQPGQLRHLVLHLPTLQQPQDQVS